MVSVRRSWLLLAALLLVVSCAHASSGSASPARLTSQSPSANAAHTQAVDLRARLDLLVGEHAMIIAKQAAAARAHNDEYTGYATLLTINSNELADLVGGALGNQAAAEFRHAWDMQNGYLVDYTIGIVTHDAAKSSGAASGLQNGFVPQFAQVLVGLAQLPVGTATQVSMQTSSDLKAMLDSELAQSFSSMYPQLHIAYTDATMIGDPLATRTARQYPDKFPGDPASNAADARVFLNMLLQEHAYLATMATDAKVAARGAEGAAALGALAENRKAMIPLLGGLLGASTEARFGELWATLDAALIAYAGSGDTAAASALRDAFASHLDLIVPGSAGAARDQVGATVELVDDQRGKSYARVAGDDRAAAAAMQPLADRIA